MIVNCTPHAIDVYSESAPAVVTPGGRYEPLLSIPPSGVVARLAEVVLDGLDLVAYPGAEAVRVTRVEYAHAVDLPDPCPGRWHVVSLPLALALPKRRDLLVSYRQVRNAAGTVVGCRGLSRPS